MAELSCDECGPFIRPISSYLKKRKGYYADMRALEVFAGGGAELDRTPRKRRLPPRTPLSPRKYMSRWPCCA